MRWFLQKIINLVGSLKLDIRGAIVGCSARNLRRYFHGKISIAHGNELVFDNMVLPNARCVKPVYIKITGQGNRVVFKGMVSELHPHLEVGGENNLIEIGDNFRVDAKGLIWYWFGKNNKLRIGKNAWFSANPHVWDGFNRITLGGEECSVEFGDNFKGNVIISSMTHKSAYKWSFSCGRDCILNGVTLDAASACSVSFGDGVFAAWDFYVWCGAHAILDADGTLLNHCKGVRIGNNVWIGHGVEIPGAVTVADDCVIGGHVLLVTDVNERGSVVASPKAKVVPADVIWKRESPVMIKRNQEFHGRSPKI